MGKLNQRNLFIVIPGNPGMPYAYDNFIQSLQEHHKGDAFYCHPHLGQAQGDGFYPSLTIDDLIQDHATFIKEKVDHYRDHQLILIGHSLGGLLGLELFRKRLIPIQKLFLLCPFIELSFPNKWFVNGLKRKPFQDGLKHFVNLVNRAPPSFQKPIQRFFKLRHYGPRIFEDFSRESFRYNFFSLLKK